VACLLAQSAASKVRVARSALFARETELRDKEAAIFDRLSDYLGVIKVSFPLRPVYTVLEV